MNTYGQSSARIIFCMKILCWIYGPLPSTLPFPFTLSLHVLLCTFLCLSFTLFYLFRSSLFFFLKSFLGPNLPLLLFYALNLIYLSHSYLSLFLILLQSFLSPVHLFLSLSTSSSLRPLLPLFLNKCLGSCSPSSLYLSFLLKSFKGPFFSSLCPILPPFLKIFLGPTVSSSSSLYLYNLSLTLTFSSQKKLSLSTNNVHKHDRWRGGSEGGGKKHASSHKIHIYSIMNIFFVFFPFKYIC